MRCFLVKLEIPDVTSRFGGDKRTALSEIREGVVDQ